jgi:hypothetical protein
MGNMSNVTRDSRGHVARRLTFYAAHHCARDRLSWRYAHQARETRPRPKTLGRRTYQVAAANGTLPS